MNYGFVGLGIRWSSKYGTVYNSYRIEGVLIKTKTGKILLDSQRAKELLNLITTQIKTTN